MSVYTVELDGHEYEIEGDKPPTEDDVRKLLAESQPQQEAAPSKPPGELETAAESAALGAGPAMAASAAFGPGFTLGLPTAPYTYGAGPFITGGVASLLAGGAVGLGEEKLLDKYAPGLYQRISAGRQANPKSAFVGQLVAPAAGFRPAPLQALKGVLSIPKVLRGTAGEIEKKAVGSLAAQTGTQLGIETARTLALEKRLPTPGELLQSASIAALYGHPHDFLVPENIKAQIKDYYASRKQKAAEVHGPVRPQPQQGAEQVPATPGGERVQPQPEAVGQEAQIPLSQADRPQIFGSDQTGWTLRLRGSELPIFKTQQEAEQYAVDVITGKRTMPAATPGDPRLTDEMERLAIEEGENVGTPVTPVDKLTGEDDATVPFAKDKGDHGIFLMATGQGAELHRKNFSSWVTGMSERGFTRDQIKEMVQRRVNEEKIHNSVSQSIGNTGTADYWNNLTSVEKNIEAFIYGGETELGPLDTPERMGHEAIRRRIQQAMGLTPSEFLEAVGIKEKVQFRTLDALGKIIRGSRELLGTDASTLQRELYDKALSNINFAKAALASGQLGPGAKKRQMQPWEDPQDADDAFLAKLYERGVLVDGKHYTILPEEQAKAAMRDLVDYGPESVIGYAAGDIYYHGYQNALEIAEDRASDFPSLFNKMTLDAVRRLKDSKVTLGPVLPPPQWKSEVQQRFPFAKMRGGGEERPSEEEFYALRAKIDERGVAINGNPVSNPDTYDAVASVLLYGYDGAKQIADSGVRARLQRAKEKGVSPESDAAYVWLKKKQQIINSLADVSVGLGPELPPPEWRDETQTQFPFSKRRFVKSKAQKAAEEQEKLQGQAGMFGNVIKTPSQIPPTPLEQRQVETRTPVGQLENAAAHIFAGFNPGGEAKAIGEGPPIGEATEPTFQNLLDWARRNIDPNISPTAVFDTWMNEVSQNIERWPGTKLNDMLEKLGVEHRVYPWKRKYAGAPVEYTRVEVPDFQKIPEDPLKVPAAIEAAVRERVLEEEAFPDDATDEQIEKAQDKAVERVRQELMALTKTEKGETVQDAIKRKVDERESIIKRQKLRTKALSAIYQRVIEEGAPTISDLSPTDIKIEDIAFNNPNAKNYGAYRTITPAERANPSKLRDILAEEARKKGDPVSNTKRLVVMLNKRTGEVALVSAFPEGRTGIRIVEPSGATGKRGKPNVPIGSAQNRGWDPIISVLKRSPVKDFYKGFKDIAEYNRYLGTEAADLERSSVGTDFGTVADDVHEEVPEFATRQDWLERSMATEPTEHDVTTLMEERQRPTEEFIGPQPSEVTGEEFRPGSAVERGEGGGFVGPESEPYRLGPGEYYQSTPLTAKEAMAVHNWLNDPEEWSGTTRIVSDIEKATTKPEMREALQRLADLAENNQLKPRQWNVVIALRKMALEQYRRDRAEFADMLRDARDELKGQTKDVRESTMERLRASAPTAESSMVSALDRIYEINQISDKQSDYLAHTMGEFARPTPEAKGPETVPGKAPEKGVQRELTARERVAPTVVRYPDVGLRGEQADPYQQWLARRSRTLPAEATPGRAPVTPPEMLPEMPTTGEKQTDAYVPTQYLVGVPVTPGKVGGERFTGEAPKGVAKLMPHEKVEEGLRYPESVAKTKKRFIGPLGPGATIREVKELAEKNWKGIGTFIHDFFEDIALAAQKAGPVKYQRAQTEHDVRAALDGADRAVENYSVWNSNSIRSASVKPADAGGKPPKPTLYQRLLGGVIHSPEAVRVRESAKAVVGALHFVDDDEWARVVRQWAEAIKEMGPTWAEDKKLHRKHTPIPEDKEPKFVRRGYDGIQPYHFDRMAEQVREGMENARKMMKATKLSDRIVGRRWLRSQERLMREVEYAREHYKDPEMRKTVDTYLAVQNQHLDNMNRVGMNVSGRDYYVPGRYEGAIWADGRLLFGDMRIMGRQFRLPKAFRSYYEAGAKEPWIPVDYDIADLAQHSLAAGGRIMATDSWKEGLKRIMDPVSNKPIAIEPEWGRTDPVKVTEPAFDAMVEEIRPFVKQGQFVPSEVINGKILSLLRDAGITKMPFGFHVPKGYPEYDLVTVSPRSKPIAVRHGYEKLVKTATAQSSVRDIPLAGQALTASQMLKHGAILIFDTFHPGRLLQYAGALAGKNIWSAKKPGFHGGLSALMWAPEQMDEAIKIGAITQKNADWAREVIQVYDKNVIRHMTRQELLGLMTSRGLMATQTADALYRNSIQRIPFIGEKWNELLSPANKWIFDRITPGVIAESAINNMERLSQTNKHLSLIQQVREVVRDMNVFYGNMGRNGIFKHPTARDLAQIFLLAPLWQEGLIGKELRTLSRLSGISYGLGRRGLGADVYFGPLVRGVVRGLGAYFILTQMINLASRGKWTFQNEEEGHKLDAWLPVGGDKGVWLSPMSVFGEVAHDLWRLGESKPKIWDGITQFGRNKLGPIGRLGFVLAEGKSPTGEQISTTGGVLGRAAQELAPAPISIGTFARGAAHAVAPGLVSPTRPGQLLQRGLGSVGIKTQVSTRTETDVRRLADAFVKKNNLSWEPLAFTPTDQASYAKLRGALRNEDEAGAAKVLTELRRHRTDDQILKAMRLEAKRPFTGSRANESLFLYSLDDHQLNQYFKANMDRAADYQNFLNFFIRQPR